MRHTNLAPRLWHFITAHNLLLWKCAAIILSFSHPTAERINTYAIRDGIRSLLGLGKSSRGKRLAQ